MRRGSTRAWKCLRAAEPDAVLLINPDCRLRPGALAVMADALSADHRGIVAPRLLNLDGSLQPSCVVRRLSAAQ